MANVSRGVLSEARRLGVPICVVEITASPEVLAQRLAGRGREGEAARDARVERNALYAGGLGTDHILVNDGSASETAHGLTLVIEGCLAPQRTPAA